MNKENNQLTSSRKFVIRDINAALSAPISRIKTLRDDQGRGGFTLIELLGAASKPWNVYLPGRELSGSHPTYKHGRGFTLIELLVVVLIIGILAAVAVPQYQKAVVKSRAAENLVRFNTLNRAQKISFLATGAFTTNLNNLDVGMNNIFCYKSGDMFVCNGGKFGLYGHFEWHGLITGQTRLACYAQNSVEVEKKLCESYYQDWGGTQTGSTIGNWIYYYGPWE